MLKNFRCYQLAVEVYRESKKVKLPSYLREQLLRASSSVVLNLSEGSARASRKDRRRFYNIALASTREVQSILDLEGENLESLKEIADKLGGGIYRLCQHL